MAMEGRPLNRAQVAAWKERWSYTDRACVTAALGAVPDGICILPPSGGYVGVWSDDRLALTIHPGYLWWRDRRFAEDLPPDLFPDMQTDEKGDPWHELSTFRPHLGGSPSMEPVQECCPIHGLALPLTGVCDDCG